MLVVVVVSLLLLLPFLRRRLVFTGLACREESLENLREFLLNV